MTLSSHMIILDLFVSQGKISELDKKEILSDSAVDLNFVIDDMLEQKGVKEDDIVFVRKTLFGLPVYDNDIPDNSELLKYISTTQCKKMMVAPLSFEDGILNVGVVDPERGQVTDSLQFLLGTSHVPYKLYLIKYSTWKKRFGISASSVNAPIVDVQKTSQIGRDVIEHENRALGVKQEKKSEKEGSVIDISDIDPILDGIENVQVPQMVSMLLRYAIDKDSSDIHIEHMEQNLRIRCRMDGSLQTVVTMDKEIHPMLVARIKILSGMKLDEKRKPQDGRFSTRLDSHTVDYRVSSFPSYYGEKVVIRILDSFRGVRKIDTVGFRPDDLAKVKKALQAPYGIILISGPTGSGKTTTLYAMLQELDREHKNVVSLEDPVEYNLDSISQSQVFPEIGYTFASGLRSILRQDPDIIMVGEIRDQETAELAIQAALTGHLVFSTIHTNTAVGVITRLLDMGVAPYLIAPTIRLAIGQRLLRRIDDDGYEDMPENMTKFIEDEFKDVSPEIKSTLPLNQNLKRAKDINGALALKGRQPVFEVLELDEELRSMISDKADEGDLVNKALSKGMLTLKQDAIIKCIEGKVPFSELHEI